MTKKKHMKLVIQNRARFFIFMTCLVLLVLALVSIWRPWSASGLGRQEVLSVVVGPEDTLWKLAEDYYGKEKDPREGVYVIKAYNKLSTSEIYSGQTLLIPQ